MKTIGLTFAVAVWTVALHAQTNLPASPPAPPQTPVSGTVAGRNEIVAAHSPAEMVILINSDHWRGYGNSNTAVWFGNVHLNDAPQMELTCDTFTFEMPKLLSGKFQRATAEGNVVIDFLNNGVTNHATAEKMVYTFTITNVVTSALTNSVTNKIAVLSGNPVVTNLQAHIEGDPILWDLTHQTIDIPNSPKMRFQPSGTNTLDLFGPPGQSKTNAPRPKLK